MVGVEKGAGQIQGIVVLPDPSQCHSGRPLVICTVVEGAGEIESLLVSPGQEQCLGHPPQSHVVRANESEDQVYGFVVLPGHGQCCSGGRQGLGVRATG